MGLNFNELSFYNLLSASFDDCSCFQSPYTYPPHTLHLFNGQRPSCKKSSSRPIFCTSNQNLLHARISPAVSLSFGIVIQTHAGHLHTLSQKGVLPLLILSVRPCLDGNLDQFVCSANAMSLQLKLRVSVPTSGVLAKILGVPTFPTGLQDPLCQGRDFRPFTPEQIVSGSGISVRGQSRPQPRQFRSPRHFLFKIMSRNAASPATPEEALVCLSPLAKQRPCMPG